MNVCNVCIIVNVLQLHFQHSINHINYLKKAYKFLKILVQTLQAIGSGVGAILGGHLADVFGRQDLYTEKSIFWNKQCDLQ